MAESNNSSDEIRLTDLFHVLLKNRLLIILLTVLGLIVGVVLSMVSYLRGEMSREYAVTSAIAVTSSLNRVRPPSQTAL